MLGVAEDTRAVRRRDPEMTRSIILDAAQECLARDGAEGVSVSGVAKIAGVNRGTAYQHFQSKESLIQATLDRVSRELCESVFGGMPHIEEFAVTQGDLPEIVSGVATFSRRLAEFTIDNPDMSRIWLYDVLSREQPEQDPFYRRFLQGLHAFTKSGLCDPGLDPEALAVTILSGYFMWPVLVSAKVKTPKDRRFQARRMAHEVLRIQCVGVFNTSDVNLMRSLVEAEFE
jgi:AcrR family transcriptional regulator